MDKNEINEFLSYLATERHVSASTQNQAFGALLFLYRYALNLEFELGNNIIRAKRSKHNAEKELIWQLVFPASTSYFYKEKNIERRHHLHESAVQREIKKAIQHAEILKKASCQQAV